MARTYRPLIWKLQDFIDEVLEYVAGLRRERISREMQPPQAIKCRLPSGYISLGWNDELDRIDMLLGSIPACNDNRQRKNTSLL